jgi:hypothetical protein
MRTQISTMVLVTTLTFTTACSEVPASNRARAAPTTPVSFTATGAKQITIMVDDAAYFDPSAAGMHGKITAQ